MLTCIAKADALLDPIKQTHNISYFISLAFIINGNSEPNVIATSSILSLYYSNTSQRKKSRSVSSPSRPPLERTNYLSHIEL